MAIPTDVRNAVVGAYYPRALGIPDTARSRAQAAYGIASAIAAALVAAGVFGDLDQRSDLVQVLGIASLVGWLVAAGFFLVAVSGPFHEASATQNTVEAFVYAALEAATKERDSVDRWQRRARFAAGLAALLTVATLVAALIDTPSDAKTARITLSEQGTVALASACGRTLTNISGTLSPDNLEKEFVSITMDQLCDGSAVTIAVPRAQIQAVAFEP